MRSVIVAGAGDGIGAAIAIELHRKGHAIVIVSRGEKGKALASRLQVQHIGCDLTKEEEVHRMVTEARLKLGKIDAVVHTAGGFFKKETIEGTDADFFRNALLNNALTFYHVVRATVGTLKSNGSGSIVGVSAAPNVYLNSNIGYAAAKGSIHFMVRQLALELMNSNITVNGISPGFFDRGEDHFSDSGSKLLQTGRLPGESIARAVTFLLDNPLITGQMIEVDGGHSTNIQSGL